MSGMQISLRSAFATHGRLIAQICLGMAIVVAGTAGTEAGDSLLDELQKKAEDAAQQLEKSGVQLNVRTKFAAIHMNELTNVDPKVLDWLRQWRRYPGHSLGAVTLRRTTFRGLPTAEVVHDLSVHGVRSLRLLGMDVGDEIWAALVPNPYLESLCLAGTRVTGAKMWAAAELARLRDLDLGYTQLDDIAYPAIAACFPNLEELDLRHSAITDREFPFLIRLKQLRSLNLSHTNITSAAFKAIPDMHSRAAWGVEDLYLEGTDIDNEAITGGLSELPRLQSLTLSGTKVDAKGLRTLAEMTQFGYFRALSYLDVDETQIDAETKKYVEEVIRKNNWNTYFKLRVVPRRQDR